MRWLAEWHHQCNGHELGQTSGDGEGQEGLACCCLWGCKVGHDWVTEQHLYSSLFYSVLGKGLGLLYQLYFKVIYDINGILLVQPSIFPN